MRVLIAVDGHESSERAAAQARRLFGPDADYLAINVMPTPTVAMAPAMGYGAVYGYPVPPTGEERERIEDRAEQVAAQSAVDAGLPGAEAIGEIGDPATMIVEAADEHAADVIVVAPSDKGWFSRLLSGSVSRSVVRDAHVPVLVAR